MPNLNLKESAEVQVKRSHPELGFELVTWTLASVAWVFSERATDGSAGRCSTSHQLLCFISPWQTLYNLRHDKHFGGHPPKDGMSPQKITPPPNNHPLTRLSMTQPFLCWIPLSLSLWQNADQLLSHSGCLYPQTLLAVSWSHKCQKLSTLTSLHDGKLDLALSKLSFFFFTHPCVFKPKHTHPLTIVHCGQTIFAIGRDAI